MLSGVGGPLAGIRVLEIPGPYGEYAGKLLADLGADVILVEPPGGAVRRRQGPFVDDVVDSELSLSFAYFNTSKRGITLDLGAPEDRASFAALAATADVVLDGSGVPTAAARPGIGYEALLAVNRRLVYVAVTPFGLDGPYVEREATDLILMAMGGLLSLGGYRDGEPVRAYGDQSYLAAGQFATIGTLLALFEAGVSGEGQLVDVSAQASVVMAHENAVQYYDLEKVVKRRNGGDVRQAAVGVYECQDGHIYLLATGLGLFWPELVKWLEAEGIEGAESLRDGKWQEDAFAQSAEGKAEFREIWNRLAMHRSKAELYEAAKKARLLMCPVNTPGDLATMPQLLAREYFTDVPHVASDRTLKMPGVPYKLAATPAGVRRPAPVLGEHNTEVLSGVASPVSSSDPAPSAGKRLPLHGVRVVDFTWLGAGPYTTRVLADHGAEVVKIESSKRMDRLRILGPFRDKVKGDSVNRSGYFADRNSNKLDVTINLKSPEGVALVLGLIAKADVVASNFTPGTLGGLGLGYEQVRAVRPDIIYLEMGMQGASGPDAKVVGYGQTVSALTGLYHLSGLPGRFPVGTGTNYPDHVPAPCHSAIAVLAALHHRRRTGEGQRIDVSQAETMVSLLGPAILDFTVNGRVAMPNGNRDLAMAPHGVYPAAGDDRWLALAVRTDEEWKAAADELGSPDLADDDRFSSLETRHRNHDALDAEIGALTATREVFDLAAGLQSRGVAAAVVETYQDLIESDEQLRHRGHFAVLDHPEMGPSIYTSPPFKLLGTDEATMRAPAPLFGQHTRKVCSELLGLDDDEIDRLVAGRDPGVSPAHGDSSNEPAAIVGVGITPQGKIDGSTNLSLQTDAFSLAIADAGLEKSQIDGLLSEPATTDMHWALDYVRLGRALGINPAYSGTMAMGGATAGALVEMAAMAVKTGMAQYVACCFGDAAKTGKSRPLQAAGGYLGNETANNAVWGAYGAATWSAFTASRHMALYGTTTEQLAEVAVAARGHASLNPEAMMRIPITVEDHQASRMIVEPFRLLDCCLVSDGGACLIVTTAERARDLRKPPVLIAGMGQGFSTQDHENEGWWYGPHQKDAVERAYSMAGIGPDDVQVAQLYDNFTISVILWLEHAGFCAVGEGGSFVENGRIRLGGRLPVNTHGGHLSAAHPQGWWTLGEGVQQIRGESGERQVQGAEVCLVAGRGLVLNTASALVLTKD